MGPDEFHEKYPGSDEPGLRNNAYTNIMVAWLMDTVAEALERLDGGCRAALLEKLGVANEDLALWSEMSGKLFVPFHGEGIISQFEGYEALKALDWDAYREKYDNIQRMDRILEAEGDSADEYQLSKQADVLMLFYLFPSGELKHLFGKLGYPFDSGTIQRNVEYYEARTSHGSTLSNLVHAAVTASYAPDEAWRKYLAALESDVADIQGGTTKEGIHLGVMAGTVDLLDLRPRAAGTPRGPHLYPVFPRSTARRGGLGGAVDARRAARRPGSAGGSRRDGDRHAGAGGYAGVQPVLIAHEARVLCAVRTCQNPDLTRLSAAQL